MEYQTTRSIFVRFTLLSLIGGFLASCASAPSTTVKVELPKDTVKVAVVEEIQNGRRLLSSLPAVTQWTGYLLSNTGEQRPLNISLNNDRLSGTWILTNYNTASSPQKIAGAFRCMFDSVNKQSLRITFAPENASLGQFTVKGYVKERVTNDSGKPYYPPGFFVIESDTAQSTAIGNNITGLFLMNSQEIVIN